MKNSLLPVVYNKQTRLQLLELANFFTSLHFASSVLHPLSPKRDQHQISPFNINANVKQGGHENYGHDHTRCLILSTSPHLLL